MTEETGRDPALNAFAHEARGWFRTQGLLRRSAGRLEPGEGVLSTAVFPSLQPEDERLIVERARSWVIAKSQRGFHAITWPKEFGGLGLARDYAQAFTSVESEYAVPEGHDLLTVTTNLVAPTILQYGTRAQRERYVAAFLRTDELCCQLFSEPGAGSDLASLRCRARRDGDSWLVTGQKVWSSGAQFAQHGELIARSDPSASKHAGLTAFIVPLDLPGIEIRPIRQMTGGSSFNEVFFDDVRVPDAFRLGQPGEGWSVTLATLGFERDHSGPGDRQVGGSWDQLHATAKSFDRTDDALVRQTLAHVYAHSRVEQLLHQRAADARRDGRPAGPEASGGKLLWTENLRRVSAAIGEVVGPHLVADSGVWGGYPWSEHVVGAPGFRIAGGSDEIQRNILAERVLGLPRDPH